MRLFKIISKHQIFFVVAENLKIAEGLVVNITKEENNDEIQILADENEFGGFPKLII